MWSFPFATNIVTHYERLSTEPPQPEFAMGIEEQSVKPEGTQGDFIAKCFALGALAVTVGFTWSLALKDGPASYSLFTLHPLLMSVGFALVIYAILTLQPTTQPATKAAGLARHQLALLYFALPSFVVGAAAVFFYKESNSANHFTTWHGTVGLVAMLSAVFQACVGAGSVWFDGKLFGGGAKAKSVWKYHRLSGYFLFLVLLANVHLAGAWSNWSQGRSTPYARVLAYTFAPTIIEVSVFLRIRFYKMKVF